MVSDMSDVDGRLSKLYYDPKSSAAFTSANHLYRAVNKHISLNKIRDFLSAQRVYSLHKIPRKKFQRERILVYRKNELFEMDLADMTEPIAKENDGFRYIFMCIDVLSKFLYATPIQNKKPETIMRVLKDLFKKVTPRFIRSDFGGEFSAHTVQKFIKDQGIVQYFTRNEVTKAAVVERVIQTIKSRLYKYFSYTGRSRYLEILDDIISGYNNSYHTSIKMSPSSVITFQDEMKAYFNLFPINKPLSKPIFK